MLNKIQATIQKNNLISAGSKVLVACSGGPDSALLLYALHRLGYNLCVASFNHKWREGSNDEITMVKNYALTLGADCVCGEGDPVKFSEEEARKQRWQFLQTTAQNQNCQTIAVGHNLDDRLATAVMNLLRGCGAHGLSAMPYQSGNISRPLLDCSADEIRAFCKAESIPCAIDPTNSDTNFKRNLVRQQLAPLIENTDTVIRSLNNITTECKQLDYINSTRLGMWMREVREDWMHGFKSLKILVSMWEEKKFDDYVGIIFEAIRLLRGTNHNISSEFVKRIVHLALHTPQGKAIEQDISCFTWKGHLYILLDFTEPEPWGPIRFDGDEIDVPCIGTRIRRRGSNGILRSYDCKRTKKMIADYEVPPFMRNRVAFYFDDEEGTEPEILIHWPWVKPLP